MYLPHIDAIVSQLTGVTKQSNVQWNALCPAHEDTTASLRVGVGKKKEALLTCHAGCNLDAILQALGKTWRDLYAAPVEREVIAEYIYRLADGTPSFRVVKERNEDGTKGYRQHQYDGLDSCGNTTWKKKKGDATPVLYRWNEWGDGGPETMVIVEGEKDVDTLGGLGIVSTTMAGGADANWRDDYSEALKAAGVRRVVLIPDHDAAGKTWTNTVAAGCRAAGLDVRVVTLADHVAKLAEKSDVSDVLERGEATAEQIQQWVADAPAATTNRRRQWRKLGEFTADELNPPEAVWPGWMLRGKLHMLAGSPEAGKTFSYLDLVARWSDGRPMPDGAVLPKLRTIIMSSEDGAGDTIGNRLVQRLGIQNRDAVIVLGESEMAGMRLSNKDDRDELIDVIKEHRADVVIVDTLASVMGGSESEEEVRETLAHLLKIAAELDVVVLAIKHTIKDRQRYKDLLSSISGSGAYGAVTRLAWFYVKDEAEDRTILTVEKFNLGKKPPMLAYRITDNTPAIEWDRNVNVDVRALWTGETEKSNKRHACIEWMRDLLSAGPVAAKEVQAQAESEGFSYRQWDGAARALGVIKERASKGKPSMWRLPSTAGDAPAPQPLDELFDPADLVPEPFMTSDVSEIH